MALFIVGIKGDSPASLQANVNAFLTSLALTIKVDAVQLTCGDVGRIGGMEFGCTITYETGASALASPFQCIAVLGRTALESSTLAQSAVNANPSYFWSSDFTGYAGTDGRRTYPYLSLIFFNTSAAAAANWAADGTGTGGGSTPTGAAGGDLAGLYPNPTLAILYNQITGVIPAAPTAIDSEPVATYGDIEWELELVKGGNTRYATLVRANNDSATVANHTESCVTLTPGAGTFDFTISVDVVAGNMRLVVTPATTGWSYRLRRRALAA